MVNVREHLQGVMLHAASMREHQREKGSGCPLTLFVNKTSNEILPECKPEPSLVFYYAVVDPFMVLIPTH